MSDCTTFPKLNGRILAPPVDFEAEDFWPSRSWTELMPNLERDIIVSKTIFTYVHYAGSSKALLRTQAPAVSHTQMWPRTATNHCEPL